jgi:[protein-PII] uridylyltransferase
MTRIDPLTRTPYLTLGKSREDLISRFLQGTEPQFTEKYTQLLDEYFQESYEKSRIGPGLKMTKNPYGVIALGGYGRKEQCLFSDVDLLFLFEKKVMDEADGLIKEMVYPLWDMGLDVGHATRSIKECVGLAKKDISVLTSLLDARFICGMSNVYLDLMDQIRRKVVDVRANRIIEQLVETNAERHRYFGDSSYRLEPNLKEGVGGLRDYHTMLWIARIKSNIKVTRDLEYEGFLSHGEYERLNHALDFIFLVRSRLHELAGRKSDRLHFEHQIKLAGALGFEDSDGRKGVEQFLGKLHGEMEFIKQLYRVFLYDQGFGDGSRRKKKPVKKTRVEGLEIQRGMISFNAPEALLEKPTLIMEIFRESDRYHLPLSAEAKRLVREFLYILDDEFRRSPRMIKLFERILVFGDPSFNVLDEMLDTGLLAGMIPEVENIRNRIQFDEYHLYPVDKHSLHAVQTVQKWRNREENHNEPMCVEVYGELKNPALLHWAVLLHDIGKGYSTEDHAITGEAVVRTLLKSLGFPEEDVLAIAFLVREHLFLIKTATRRDINDEETCLFCARRVKDPEWLKMLYLLTIADSVSTGPNAWNEWTASLLRNLFIKVLKMLEKGDMVSEADAGLVDEKKRVLREALKTQKDPVDLEKLLGVLPPRYLMSIPADDMVGHIKLYDRLKNQEVIWEIAGNGKSNTRTVTICAKDAPGLFFKIAGVFTLNSIDILNVQVFTWRNNTALDIFEVKPPPDPVFEEEKWDRALKNLKAVISGELDLEPALKLKMDAYRMASAKIKARPIRVKVDNNSSSFFTIIEVFAYDYSGLLYDITHTLFTLGLDVWVAKIATKVDQVVDVFYVRDFDGQKVDSRQQEEQIIRQLKAVIRIG